MASSSRQPTSYQSIVFPDRDQIDLNFSFVHNWWKALRAQPHGTLDLPNGVIIPVDLTISAFQAHINSGKTVARTLGIQFPTKVQLDYLVKDNRFKMEIVGPVTQGLGKYAKGSEKSASKEVMVEETIESSEESEGDDWLHRNLPPKCYKYYDWETRLTSAMVRKKNPEGMRIPHQTMKFALSSCLDQCVLLTEDVGRKRRLLVGGWFDFLRQYNLRAGDVLKFYLDYPADQLYVDIVRRKSL